MAKKEKPERDKTVDFAIGSNKNGLILVEAKFEVKNASNISKGEIKDKIDYSRVLLKSYDISISIDETVIILLSDYNYQQNFNKLKRVFANSNKILPNNVKAFHDLYFNQTTIGETSGKPQTKKGK